VLLLHAYSSHGGVAAALGGEGQSDPECRNGGDAEVILADVVAGEGIVGA
jgi:hypothetical protein